MNKPVEKKIRIALLGYGRMGKEVERIAIERGHEIICKIDNKEDWQQIDLFWNKVDIAIDFSVPSAVVSNIEYCLNTNKPLVVGTTAWQDQEPRLRQLCVEKNGAIIASSNFSIGVNIFFGLIKRAAEMMKNNPQYKGYIQEIHHVHKLDAPSGTAVVMNNIIEDITKEKLPINSIREGENIGEHKITFDSKQDILEIKHAAKSREGLALGAIIAAEWLCLKKGWFNMHDVLGF